MARYFYSPGQLRIIDEVFDNCVTCTSLRKLPKEIFSESTSATPTFGSSFSADVIKKDHQLIFVCREKLSQFTTSKIISEETADCLRDTVVAAVIEYIPENGAKIQVDCAPAFQKLASECSMNGSILKKLGIIVDLGRTLNVNKNPIAENCVKEFLKERLRLSPHGGPISELERAQITKNMNSRIREREFTAKEIAFNRDQISNQFKNISDLKLSESQVHNREARHPSDPCKVEHKFEIGNNVFLKKDLSKLKGREVYMIVKIYKSGRENMATIRKCDDKFMAKDYEVKLNEIFPMSDQTPAELETDGKVDEEPDVKKNETGTSEEKSDDSNVEEPAVVDVNENKPEAEIGSQLAISEKDAVYDYPKKKTNAKHKKAVKDDLNMETEADNPGRPRRKAAIKQRRLLKELVADAALRIEAKKPAVSEEAPTHGFDYQEWLALLNDDDEQNLRKPRCMSKPSSGLESLRTTLLNRNINPDPCVVEILEIVHDYIDSHTICARIEMAATKIQTWFRKISTKRLNTAAMMIQKWFRGIMLKRSLTHENQETIPDTLAWDHSPQDPNSEANFAWTDNLHQRRPEDFIRLFTDELFEDVEDNIPYVDEGSPAARNRLHQTQDWVPSDHDLSHTSDEEVFQPAPAPAHPNHDVFNRRLVRSGAVRRTNHVPLNPNRAPLPTTPLLPGHVLPDRSQYLGPALDVVHAEQNLDQNEASSPGPRRSGRLRTPNPNVTGDLWMQ